MAAQSHLWASPSHHASLPTHSPLARTQSCNSTKLQRKLGNAVLLGDQEEKEIRFLDHIELSLPESTHLFTICSHYVPHRKHRSHPKRKHKDHPMTATSSSLGSWWGVVLFTRSKAIPCDLVNCELEDNLSAHTAPYTGYLKLKLPSNTGKHGRSNPCP